VAQTVFETQQTLTKADFDWAVERIIASNRETEQRLRNEIVQLEHKLKLEIQKLADKHELSLIQRGTQFTLLRWMTFTICIFTFLIFIEVVLFRGK